MAAIEPKDPILSLSARMEERFLAPFKRNAFAARTWHVVTAAVVAAIYAGGLLFLLRWDSEGAQRLAKQEETPVEIVVEQPKPPPPPPEKKQEPQKAAKQEIEKPATSAPRAPNEEKVETQAQDKETRAPKAPAPPADGKPDAAKEAASPNDKPAEPEKTEAAAEKKPDTPDKDAEPLDKQVPLPPKKPVMKEAKVKPPAKLRREAEMRRLAGASDLPDYKFARPTKKSPVYGGSEDSRYLAIVYGMIMRKYRRTALGPSNSGSVTVTFNVDGGGSVVEIGIAQTSGYTDIDAEAVRAIRRASPFPPPPPGAPHGLIATLDVVDAGQEVLSGPRER